MSKLKKYRIVEVPTKGVPYYIVEQQDSFLWFKYWDEATIPEYHDKNYHRETKTFNNVEEAELFLQKIAERKQKRVVKELEL